MNMHHFRKLHVYQRGLELTREVYILTATFPSDELYGLTSQIRRASYSIPMNIAEGAGRKTSKDFSRFLDTAIGSGYECLSCLDIARRNDVIDQVTFDRLNSAFNEVIAMTVGLQKTLQ